MNITKRSILKIGTPIGILLAMLGVATINVFMLDGLLHGFWWTVSPRITPLWVVWTTRIGAIDMLIGAVSLVVMIRREDGMEADDDFFADGKDPHKEGSL